MKRLIFIVLTSLLLLNCSQIKKQNIIDSISNKIHELPYLKLDSLYVGNKTIYIEYLDSIEYSGPIVEQEILLYILNNIELKDFDKIEFKYRDFGKTKGFNHQLNIPEISEKIRVRYKDTNLSQIFTRILNDRNSEGGSMSFIFFNYYYGYFKVEKPNPSETFYQENVFELIIELSQKNNPKFKESMIIFNKICNKVNDLPQDGNKTALTNQLDFIKDKLKI